MSENPRERKQGNQRSNEEWFTVRRRRQPSNPPLSTALKTIFIDFLPPDINIQTINFIFLPYGNISDIILPPNLRKNRNHRYAFVKYSSTHSLLSAINHENGRKIGNYKLKVNPAKYDKPSHNFSKPPPPPRQPTYSSNIKPSNQPYKPVTIDHRSFKDVTNPNTSFWKPSHEPHPTTSFPADHPPTKPPTPPEPPKQNNLQPNQLLEPIPEMFERNMSKLRVMSSRVLGEETENVRENIDLEEFEGDQIIAIKGCRTDEHDEVFSRSVIAVANSASSSEAIHDHILAEGVNCLRIKPLGGLLHLITFDSAEDKDNLLNSKWLLRWFLELRNVNQKSAALWRKAWITVYGVPLTAWSYEIFFKIGNVYGKVMSIEYSKMDCAKIMIITDCFFRINNPLILDLEGDKFKIFISEENATWVNHNLNCPLSKVEQTHPDDVNQMTEDEEQMEERSPKVQVNQWSGKELEVSPIDLGKDDNNDLFNVTLESPNKTAKQPSPLKTQKTPQILSPSKPPFSGPKNSKNSPISPIGPSSKVKTSLPSLDNIQIFSPIPKPTIPSKLNLDSGYNLNLSSSPIKNQTGSPQNLTYQNLPIHLKNTSSPLSRKTSSKPHSSSSSISGPSIPPGFENFISTPLKSQREKQRIKKMQKKKERRLHSSSSVLKPPSLPNSPPPLPNEGSFDSIASEIIELGLKMGMNFNGPLSDLHCKIREILIRQNQNWSSGQ